MFLKHSIALVIIYIIAIFLVLWSLNHAFFWDTVQLGSRHATFFYKNNFNSLLLPNSMDSGHIPFFGAYLALIWKLLGRTLIASHLAMLPFVIGIVFQLNKLVSYFFENQHKGIVLIMVFLEACLLSQITLISPDIVLVFFFLMTFNSIINNKKRTLSIAVTGLFLVSMRGMMVALAMLFIDLFVTVNFKLSFKIIFRDLIKRSLIYLPALFVFIIFSIYHFKHVGWIGFHNNSPWKKSFEVVDLKGVLYNIGIIGWRFLDAGKIIVWLLFLVLVLKLKKQLFMSRQVKILGASFLIIALVLTLNMVWAKGLLQHRYLLPAYLLFSVFVAKLLCAKTVSNLFRKISICLWLFVMLTGNLWVYPDHISKGWDSTLAHLPYYELRGNTIQFIESENIEVKEVSSFFPNNIKFDYIDLNNDTSKYTSFLNQKKYVLFSNVFNVKETDYKQLIKNYKCIKTFSSPTVYISIYKRNKNN